jgi:tRNA(Ile)-lysidine synthase
VSALLQQVRRTVDRYGLCPPGSRVLIGVSGGSDSVALTLLMRDLARHGRFDVVSLAHLNHRLRPTADRDEAFCRELAGRLGMPLAVDVTDVAGLAAAEGLSIEQAARQARYAFLRQAAASAQADRIAVGHTRDDQAETFLLKLMRGAGATGLGGVYPRKGEVIRPLLDTTRAHLRAYLTAAGQAWMEDETNADLANPRNRVRHRVLPELDLAYGGPTRASIARAADLAREDAEWLDALATQRYSELARASAGRVAIPRAALEAEPMPLRRRILLEALRLGGGGREVGLVHVDAGLQVLEGLASGADVPAGRWELSGTDLVLYSSARG